MSSTSEVLLELESIAKFYGDTPVLSNGRLNVRAGEIHALLGGNGAGKSTLVRIAAGLVRPSSGTMTFNQKPYSPQGKSDAEEAGIEIVQQEFNLIPTLTVGENLLLSRLPNRFGKIQTKELRRKAQVALDRLELHSIDPGTLVGVLGVGQQQMVEIASALDRNCRVLILDEPTAALSAAESETLFHWLDRLRKERVGIVYISHRLDEVARLADRITFLRDGQWAGTYEAQSLSVDDMLSKMTGEEHVAHQPDQKVSTKLPTSISTRVNEQVDTLNAIHSHDSPFALKVSGIAGGPVQQSTFEVRKGERLGIAGLVGSGRTELLRLIFGADVASEGHILIGDNPTPRRFRHPSEAVAAGLAMVTEDRKRNGLLLRQPIRINSSLAALRKRLSRFGWILTKNERMLASRTCKELEVRCTGIEQSAGTLSGGNQQKVVLSKWLATEAKVYLLDEPTRGIDIPARKRIYRLIESLASAGKGIVIVSSDIEELFEVSDRIAVMSNGMIVETFFRDSFSHDEIMRASFAGYRNRDLQA